MGQHSLTDFDYQLPPELIAKNPVFPRDNSNILIWNDKKIRKYADLDSFFEPGDVLVINTSKVIPARLRCSRPHSAGEGTSTFEVLLHKPAGDFLTWEVFAKPAKRLKDGDILTFAPAVTGRVKKVENAGKSVIFVTFLVKKDEFEDFLDEHGEMPLPPYINRAENAADKETYQTVYAETKGSVAAPTAGLHFTEDLLHRLQTKGVVIAPVTLHVGAGTFQPVKVEDLDDHQMHSEWGQVPPLTVEAINTAKAAGKRVTAVGTTSLRLLESAAQKGLLAQWEGETDIFIRPGFNFQIVDRLITNFHLPKSTLLMLVAAFIGFEEMHALYAYAIKQQLRFYSYGDGCLLERAS